MNTRTEFWLQEKNKSGVWIDSGPDVSAAAIWKNIKQLRRQNPDGEWRCMERSVVEREIPFEEVTRADLAAWQNRECESCES